MNGNVILFLLLKLKFIGSLFGKLCTWIFSCYYTIQMTYLLNMNKCLLNASSYYTVRFALFDKNEVSLPPAYAWRLTFNCSKPPSDEEDPALLENKVYKCFILHARHDCAAICTVIFSNVTKYFTINFIE